MSTIISESMFPELVAYYNKEGKTAAYDLLRSQYGMKYPGMLFSRIKKSGKFPYNPASDRFDEPDIPPSSEDIFIGLDTLCHASSSNVSTSAAVSYAEARSSAMECLVHELLGDRLLAFSHYITMDTVNRTILIDRSSLQADGYRIITH